MNRLETIDRVSKNQMIDLNDYLTEARKNPDIVPYGGPESANFYLRQQSREYVYIGQTPPMNIFSPLAWGQFFQAWKRGDFKKKKDD